MTKVNVLGTEYEIKISNKQHNQKLNRMDGYCDFTTHMIAVDELIPDENSVENMEVYKNKVIRHELIHAFLFESGLASSSDWANNEELVDWIAFQFPKMQKAFKECGCL